MHIFTQIYLMWTIVEVFSLDRVVDKLNPTQVFTKQDVVSLMEYSNEELPNVDFQNVEEEYIDPVLVCVCKVNTTFMHQNHTFHYSRRITPKRVTSLRCPSLRHSAKASQLLEEVTIRLQCCGRFGQPGI